MNYFKAMRFHLFALIVIALSVVFTYQGLPNTFFQQDEWQTLSFTTYYHSKGISGIIESFLPIDAISHFSPLATVFAWYEYIFYYANFSFYAWQSIILHIINSFLLYCLVFSWFRRRSIAFMAALFFGVNSVSHQAITWVAATNSYEVPTAFILISLIFFHKFLVRQNNEQKNLVISLFFLFISLMFHENGVFLFLFYPTIFFLFRNQRHAKLSKSFFTFSIVLTISIFILIRAPFFFGISASEPSATDISHPPITVYPYRLLSNALKSFAGSFIPEKTLITISEKIVRLAYPQFITPDHVPNPFITQSIVFDLVSYILTVFIVCIIVFFMRLIREKNIAEGLIWSLIFIPMGLLPYGFVLGKAGYASIMDSKFYYISGIGISILIALVVFSLLQKLSARKILVVSLSFLFSLYVLSQSYATKMYVHNLEKISVQRKNFLTTIKSSYKKLPQKVIFFTQSDTAYYGMPDNEKTLPVQVGFGKMLMLWYQKNEHFPGCFYENNFLLGLLTQGYHYCDGRGFGYFRQYDRLFVALGEYHLSPDVVIAYNLNSKKSEFSDITSEIRMKIEADRLYESR